MDRFHVSLVESCCGDDEDDDTCDFVASKNKACLEKVRLFVHFYSYRLSLI